MLAGSRLATSRSRAARAWLVIVLYLAIGLGGAWLFARAVVDTEWRDLFYAVWWIPSGLAAVWLAHAATAWITACRSEDSA